MSLTPSLPVVAIDDSLDARWAAWRIKAARQDERWRGYAIVVAIALGCAFAAAVIGVLYGG